MLTSTMHSRSSISTKHSLWVCSLTHRALAMIELVILIQLYIADKLPNKLVCLK